MQEFIRLTDTDGDEQYVRLAAIADSSFSKDEDAVTISAITTASSISSARSGLAHRIIVDAATATALSAYRELRSFLL